MLSKLIEKLRFERWASTQWFQMIAGVININVKKDKFCALLGANFQKEQMITGW
jgi:hypothetical protein